jgi:predicted amidohydrolase
MTRTIRVAALQLPAHDRDAFVHSTDHIIEAVRSAAVETDLLVLPEATFPGYVLGSSPIDQASVTAALDALGEVAASEQTVIVAGAAATVEGEIRNAAFVIDADGSLAGRADKLFLWHFDRRWFSEGTRIEPVTTRLGRLGVLICADGRIPTIARALVDGGAAALVMPTAWVTSGRDPHALENVQADLLARVRAYENGVPFIAANKCGTELDMVAYCGKSQIVDSDGEIVAIAAERKPGTLRASLTLGTGRPKRSTSNATPPRAIPVDGPLRLAISIEALPADIDERLDILDDSYGISPRNDARAIELTRVLPLAWVDDAVALDPGGLVPFRRSGYLLICWTTALGSVWVERVARARALELRLFMVVFDETAGRAFAVDPNGALVAGTFNGYRLASFTFDPRLAEQTLVAPGSDVALGLERVARITGDAIR